MRCEGLDDESITNTLHSQVGNIISEYQLMARMRENPNIVHCDDFHYTRHKNDLGWDIYIKMELLTPLTKIMNRMREESEIIRLGIELCNALTACQKHNIIHRDIKPQNIFLSPEGHYKLGDFGIARTMEHTTKATAGIGTYSFMAPEVALGKSYGPSVDIYSLGLVLYWLLNERRGPFVPLPPATPSFADNDQARMRRYSGEPIPEPKHGSPGLKAVVLKACAFDPQTRYQTAVEMMAALKAINTIPAEGTTVREAYPPENGDSQENPVDNNSNTILEERHPWSKANPYQEEIHRQKEPAEASGLQKEALRLEQEAAKKQQEAQPLQQKKEEHRNEQDDFRSEQEGKKDTGNRKRIAVIGCISCLLILLAAALLGRDNCILRHSWSDASCTQAKTCSVCGTTEGSASGHKFTAATCLEPQKCSVCGEMEGSALGHSFSAATCLELQKCSVCGETEGDISDHQWAPATYDTPQTCNICGVTQGAVKGYVESLSGAYSTVKTIVGGTNSYPWIFDENVVNCTQFTVHLQITTEGQGNVYGDWILYSKNLSGKWVELGTITVSDSNEVTKTFTFDEPISFSALATAYPSRRNVKYYYSMRFEDWYLREE